MRRHVGSSVCDACICVECPWRVLWCEQTPVIHRWTTSHDAHKTIDRILTHQVMYVCLMEEKILVETTFPSTKPRTLGYLSCPVLLPNICNDG